MLFLVCAFLFHLSNAAMLPQLGEMLTRGEGRVGSSVHVGLHHRDAGRHHEFGLVRRPIRQPARTQAALAAGLRRAPDSRVALYPDSQHAGLIAVQVLDGVANTIFGVVSVLVVADRTQGHRALQSGSGNARHGGRARRSSQHNAWRLADPTRQLSHVFPDSGAHRARCLRPAFSGCPKRLRVENASDVNDVPSTSPKASSMNTLFLYLHFGLLSRTRQEFSPGLISVIST